MIPACAGSRWPRWWRGAFAGDHPRVCGEQCPSSRNCSCRRGSSPRVRGADLAVCDDCGEIGIIPACAGSRTKITVATLVIGDHPRVCGEQAAKSSASSALSGSSPRVRGAVQGRHAVRLRVGIIPACAGSSSESSFGCLAYRDHPRVCGEQFRPQNAKGLAVGSSPRVRGAGPQVPL